LLLLGLSACSSKRNVATTDYRALVRAAQTLGFDIDRTDDHPLFLEAASWVGTPYKYGGNTRQGVDCSGLTCQIYDRVYGIRLSRRSIDQYRKDFPAKIKRNALRQGDLLFFSSPKSKGKCGHVGIYLKGQRFIHAGSRGVVVDNLDSRYWRQHWIGGGSRKTGFARSAPTHAKQHPTPRTKRRTR